MNAHYLKIEYKNMTHKSIFRALCIIAGLAVCLYMYFIGSIVFNVIARKNIEKENKALASELGQTELKYLSKLGSIDVSYAYAHGFVDAKNASYVSRQSLVSTLDLTGNEL